MEKGCRRQNPHRKARAAVHQLKNMSSSEIGTPPISGFLLHTRSQCYWKPGEPQSPP
ncbi:hypothetical protein DPMN_138540 [Dreissena polymorpha]|uniref:Uncharacterized protein n=1 Tax=Dreissena polymorpha TaxID=45954 RepID=A0A9D4JHD5_DREPO|nr:hypothetical protein DPMN_138540 [Dreissena polymorpha]